MTVKREEKVASKQQARVDHIKGSKTVGPKQKTSKSADKGDFKKKHDSVEGTDRKPKFDKKNATKAPVLNRR